MIQIIKGGNILEAKEKVIAHQVNCKHVMGSGVALAIRKAYPQHYIDYMNDTRPLHNRFGSVVKTITPEKIIFGLYGQIDYTNREVCNTSYSALEEAIVTMIHLSNGETVFALPYMIGCALGGGRWDIVEKILTDISIEYKVNFILYDLMNQSEAYNGIDS